MTSLFFQADECSFKGVVKGNKNQIDGAKGSIKHFDFFRRLGNIAKCDYWLRHVRLYIRISVRPLAWNNAALSERILMKLDI